MALGHIDIVSVPVADQDRAKAFYTDVLGFEVKADTPMGDGMRWLQLAPPGASTSIALVHSFETMTPGSLKGLARFTDDIQATYDELKARGLTWTCEPTDAGWGSFATFDDVDGNGWMVAQSRSG